LFFIATFEAFLPFSRNRKKPCVEADFVSLAGNFFALFAAANRFCKLYNFSAAGFFVRFFGQPPACGLPPRPVADLQVWETPASVTIPVNICKLDLIKKPSTSAITSTIYRSRTIQVQGKNI
jgi:hypothetical protein